MWVYGSGFPKSHDVSKAIDKAAGKEREVIGRKAYAGPAGNNANFGVGDLSMSSTKRDLTAPATDAARQWEGWGTALKPAYEPIILARKPLDGTVAANVQKWGCGSINIDGCRVGIDKADNIYAKNPHTLGTIGAKGIYGAGKPTMFDTTKGRWPANLIHDGSEEVLELFPETTSGKVKQGYLRNIDSPFCYGNGVQLTGFGDSGSAARFFYCAKASRAEREEGCEGMEAVPRFSGGLGGASIPLKGSPMPTGANHHPTVKPLALMRYLCRLVTPPGGTVLDPFMGSGTTGMAAKQGGFEFIGIEKEAEYVEIAEARIGAALEARP
jgi:site-specific DNA-methyltransferase (adenine-specific)